MRVLVTGAAGMLGATLVDQWQNKYDVFATDKEEFLDNPASRFIPFDLSSKSYGGLIDWAQPDVIIHCSAITNVDYCEKHPELTMAVNGKSVYTFLQSGARVVFISSDAVYPDDLRMASEEDETGPENIYGKSKELGEKYIESAGRPNISIRTTIVGINKNPLKQGFVEWIINSVKNRKEITLFDDALFMPISIWSLAEELEWIIDNNIFGIINIVGNNPVTKFDFGVNLCKKLGYDSQFIKRDSIKNFRFNAKRSKDQTLDTSKYKMLSNRNLPTIEYTIDQIAKHYWDNNHGRV